MEEFSALAARVAASVDDLRGVLIMSRDGLVLGAFPEGDEALVKPAWLRFASLGEPGKGFVEFSGEVWAYVRRGPYASFAVTGPRVRPGLVMDQLEHALLAAEELGARRDALRLPDASPAPGGKPRIAVHTEKGPSAPAAPVPTPASRPAAPGPVSASRPTGVGPSPRPSAPMPATTPAPASRPSSPAPPGGTRPAAPASTVPDPTAPVRDPSVSGPPSAPSPAPGPDGGPERPPSSEADRPGPATPEADAVRTSEVDGPASQPPDSDGGGAATRRPAVDDTVEVDPVLLAQEFSRLLQESGGEDET